MKIALIGYGKMGRVVEQLALKAGHSCFPHFTEEAEVYIDFSTAEATLQTAHLLAKHPRPWVLGTTGWSKERLLPLVSSASIPLLYGSNFSVGMALFRRLARLGAALFEKGYERRGVEVHHAGKRDAPSGSANTLMEEIPGLHFESRREGEEVGRHQLLFTSEEEEIVLEHRAKSRSLFAEGALLAAKWLVGRRGIYTFDHLIEEYFPCH